MNIDKLSGHEPDDQLIEAPQSNTGRTVRAKLNAKTEKLNRRTSLKTRKSLTELWVWRIVAAVEATSG